jgi:hypothetical protein
MPQNDKFKTVLELITSTDRRQLKKAIEKRFEDAELKKPSTDWLDKLIDRLNAVDVIDSDKCVIAASTHLEQDLLNPEKLEIETSSALYQREDLEKFLVSNDDADLPAAYAYEMTEWRHVLGYLTWMPSRLSEHERTQFVADIIWEITWFGDTEEIANKGISDLSDSLEKSYQEYQDHKNDPDYFKSADEVIDDLKNRFDTDQDEDDDPMDDHWSPMSQEFFHRMLDVYMSITEPIIAQQKTDMRVLAKDIAALG